MIAVIASICLGAACQDVIVTTSAQDPSVTMVSCSIMGPKNLAEWLARDWPGYRLSGWKCIIGQRRQDT